MSQEAPVTSLVVAAGAGARLPGPVPKGFRPLADVPLFLHGLAAFDRSPLLEDHVLVVPEGWSETAARSLEGRIAKPVTIVTGGSRRQDSVLRGLEAAPAGTRLIAVHDAARPFPGQELIARAVRAARASGSAVPVLTLGDTVREVGDEGLTLRFLDRRRLRISQTPQVASRARLLAAYRSAAADGVEVTDEGAALERAGFSVAFVEGSPWNFKVTTAEDLSFAEGIAGVRGRPVLRVGLGEDRHPCVPERPFVLAGVVLADRNGPAGHSDGDPLCHALIDALLGAAGDGSIGDHFPDTDERWQGAPGLELLGRAAARVREQGWRVVNVDAVVVADSPRLAPHVARIRGALASVLGVEEACVSLKGKRAEGLGFEGSGRGVAARAVALLERSAGA